MAGDILFYGDPHGNWRALLDECLADPPSDVVLLGDLCPDRPEDDPRPLAEIVAPLRGAGIAVRWIPGNHDADRPEFHAMTFASYPEGNLHGRVERMGAGGLRVAGLGGVFRQKVWWPRTDPDAASPFPSAADLVRATPKQSRWHGGLPLRHRATIFKAEAEAAARLRADVLVCHEAPSCHEHGFAGIDALARRMGARLVVHGHHHRRYEAAVGGVRVVGVALAGVFRLRPARQSAVRDGFAALAPGEDAFPDAAPAPAP